MAAPIVDIVSKDLPLPSDDASPGETDGIRSIRLEASNRLLRARQMSPIPNPLRFAPTIDARIKIVQPFTVRLERLSEGVVASAEEIEEFGQGCDAGEAIQDLGRTIAELYFSLESQADRLGPEMAALRTKLGEHIQRVTPLR